MERRSYGQPTSEGKAQNDCQHTGFNLASNYAKYINLCNTGTELGVYFIYQCIGSEDHYVRKSTASGNRAFQVINANQLGRAPEGMHLSAILVHERHT